MHLCIPAHAIPIRFHHKSPQPGCNIRSICGPHMSPNSSLEILLFRCGEEKQGREMREKNSTVNRINVCELVCDSNRWVHDAKGGGDDCALFQMMTTMSPVLLFMRLFLRRRACRRDWQQLHMSDSRPLSGPFPPASRGGVRPQKRSGACWSHQSKGLV